MAAHIFVPDAKTTINGEKRHLPYMLVERLAGIHSIQQHNAELLLKEFIVKIK